MLRHCAIVVGVVCAVLSSVVAQADVFNMGGTRDPMTGTWTGLASLEFVTVGDPGNAADTTVTSDGTTGHGSVPYVYQMGKYDVTLGQYCQFLNAVAKTDPYGLYGIFMQTGVSYPTTGITRSGSSGNYSYSVGGIYAQGVNCPMFAVTWGDAARFCNWLQHGQPTGAEGPGTTETGAYALIGDTSVLMETRNAGATYFLPSGNEWYKVAYYKGGSTNAGYWTYPTQSDVAPGNTLPDSGNNANYGNNFTDPINMLTPVGAFAASPGPYGTFDMGGDVNQWNESIGLYAGMNGIATSGRGYQGGDWGTGYPEYLASSSRQFYGPWDEDTYFIGFRVASTPEPSSITLLFAGAVGLLSYAWRRRRQLA